MVEAITHLVLTLSGRAQPINLQPFQSVKPDGRVNTYYQVAVPKKDGSRYPASRGLSPVKLPDGLATVVNIEGLTIPMTAGKTGSGNKKVSGKLDITVDGKPMVASAEISELAADYWVRFSVTNKGAGGFTARTVDDIEAILAGV